MSDAAKPPASEREALIAELLRDAAWCEDAFPDSEATAKTVALQRAAAAELSRLGKIEERAEEAMEKAADYDAAYFVAERILKGAADDA